MLLVSRLNLECQVASDDAGRFQLNGLHFTDDFVESTDGHILLRTPYADENIEEFPADGHEMPNGGGNSIVPMTAIAKVIKALPKSIRPILENAAFESGEDGKARFFMTDLDTSQKIEAKVIEGQYPDTSRVMVDVADCPKSVILGVKVLEKLLKALKKAKAESVTLGLQEEKGTAIAIEAKAGNGQTISGVVMPLVVSK